MNSQSMTYAQAWSQLTDRERLVLTWRGTTDLTLGQMAKRLYVSYNTVKSFATMGYAKLDLHSRTQLREFLTQLCSELGWESEATPTAVWAWILLKPVERELILSSAWGTPSLQELAAQNGLGLRALNGTRSRLHERLNISCLQDVYEHLEVLRQESNGQFDLAPRPPRNGSI